MYAFRGPMYSQIPNGKNKGTGKDKGDCFKGKGDKETKDPMKEGSKEKGAIGFVMISSWFCGKNKK